MQIPLESQHLVSHFVLSMVLLERRRGHESLGSRNLQSGTAGECSKIEVLKMFAMEVIKGEAL